MMEEHDEQLLQVSDLLKLHPTLGLPHFQRGGVWTDNARGLLLESLFHDTPCGSIILWKPAGPAAGVGAAGLPFPGNRESDVEWLVIDGQQRMRALRATVGVLGSNGSAIVSDDPEATARDAETDPADGGLPKVWCLNLQALPEFAGLLDGRLADQPLFIRVGEPRRSAITTGRDRRNPRHRFNLWPLALVLENDRPALQACDLRTIKGASAEAIWNRFDSIVARTRAIASRRLLVVRRREDPALGRFALDEVVQLYNRINSAGVRVESEERVFATMVRVEPRTNAWLSELFQLVHGNSVAAANDGTGLRDLVLRRAQERSFGFRLFLRAMAHAASYQFNLSLGSDAFSFASLASADVLRKLSAPDASGASCASLLQESASRAVLSLARILRDDLGCDGFQFLPETSSLVVPTEILVAYGDTDATRSILRWLVLALMLTERRQSDLMKLVRALRTASDLATCREILLTDGGLRTAPEKLSTRLAGSNAIQDRYILLLYWLVRRNRCRDLSYENASTTRSSRVSLDLSTMRGREPLVAMNMHGEPGVPQKQHIVPFVQLASILKEVKRSGRSRANNIGNFTYISPALNHFDGGIGAEPMRWDVEPEENLRAHLLLDVQHTAASNALRDYFATATDETASPQARAFAFDAFCAARRDLISRSLHAWVEELRAAVELLAVPSVQPGHLQTQAQSPVTRIKGTPRSVESILEIIDDQQRDAAVHLIAAFVERDFATYGTPAGIQFGFRTGDGRFHSLVTLERDGFWLSLRKQDRLALSESDSLAFDRGACDFGPFRRPDKANGCVVKPNALAPMAANFADYLSEWRGILLQALTPR